MDALSSVLALFLCSPFGLSTVRVSDLSFLTSSKQNFLSSYGYFRKGQPLSFPAAPVTGAGEKRYKRDATSDLTDAVR